jgi:hypothetical protein
MENGATLQIIKKINLLHNNSASPIKIVKFIKNVLVLANQAVINLLLNKLSKC